MSASTQALTPGSTTALTQPDSTTSTQQGSTTSWAPTAKVSAGILAASLTTFLLPFLTNTNFKIEAAQAAALTTLITFVIQYMVPERK